jgi:hypothetical protein
MLPAHLIAEFWDTVRKELRTRYQLPERDAAAAVAGFREALDRQDGGELIYHREPETVAEAVYGWKRGHTDPATSIPA